MLASRFAKVMRDQSLHVGLKPQSLQNRRQKGFNEGALRLFRGTRHSEI